MMLPQRYCASDVCPNEVDEDQEYCSGDCRLEAQLRAKADGRRADGRGADDDDPRFEGTVATAERRHNDCSWCGKMFMSPRGRLYCSAACKMAAWRMGERAPTVRSDRFSILLRDGFRCRYCGRSSSEDGVKLHVDHVVPRSAGGPSTRDNLVTACQDCNLGKGARILP